MSNTKKKQIIHIGINHEPAINAKKEILMSEVNLLEVIKKIRAYSALRKREFALKNKLKKAITTARTCMAKTEQELPDQNEIKIPKKYTLTIGDPEQEKAIPIEKFAKEEAIEKIEKVREKTIVKEKNREIEEELEEIRNKLAKLG